MYKIRQSAKPPRQLISQMMMSQLTKEVRHWKEVGQSERGKRIWCPRRRNLNILQRDLETRHVAHNASIRLWKNVSRLKLLHRSDDKGGIP